MHGGDTTLADKLRRLLALFAAGLAVTTGGELVFAIIQLGRSFGNNAAGLDAVLLWGGISLLAAACGLLLVGSVNLLGRGSRTRLVLSAGSTLWLGAAAAFVALQVSYARRSPFATPNSTWQTFARQVEYWITTASALPLLFFAFVGWREVIPRPPAAPAGASLVGAADTERSSLATRLMRVLSVYGIVFGGTSLLVLTYIAATSSASLPFLRLPYSFTEACFQTAAILEWSSAGLLVAGAFGEILGRGWGRKLMLIAASAWIAHAPVRFAWMVLVDTRGGVNVNGKLPLYTSIFLSAVSQSAYPLMLLVCLRWREVHDATDFGGSVGFQPILVQLPAGDRSVDSEGMQ